MSIVIVDIETAAPDGEAPVCPEDWTLKGVRDNFKPETIADYRDKNLATWPAEWRKRAALDWRLGRIVSIGTHALASVIIDLPEHDALGVFWDSLARGDRIVGFGIKSFDWPWLLMRSAVHGIVPPVKFRAGPYDTRDMVDLQDHLSHYGRFAMAGWSLSAYARLFGCPTEPVGSGAQVGEWVAAGDHESIRQHCEADLAMTAWLWDKLQHVIPA